MRPRSSARVSCTYEKPNLVIKASRHILLELVDSYSDDMSQDSSDSSESDITGDDMSKSGNCVNAIDMWQCCEELTISDRKKPSPLV